jgi:hypothetical protein
MDDSFDNNPMEYALDLELDDAFLLHMCLCYMNNDDIRAMLDANELSPRFLEEDRVMNSHTCLLRSYYLCY